MPLMNMAHATAFITIRALSFHTMATHNHPATPRNCKNILYGYKSLIVATIAKTRMIDATHFTHHVGGCCDLLGVNVFEGFSWSFNLFSSFTDYSFRIGCFSSLACCHLVTLAPTSEMSFPTPEIVLPQALNATAATNIIKNFTCFSF